MEERKEYIIARTPDKMRLANLINMAKGPNRTMAQFAELCNVSASTLSRAVNGKITKPLAQELIYALVENAAEEMSLDNFMRANGMIEKEEYQHREKASDSFYFRRQNEIDREVVAKNIISTELLKRGHLIRFFNRLPSREGIQSKFGFRYSSDFALWVEDKRYMWNFIVRPTVMSELEPRDIRFLKMRTVERFNQLFLMDAWEPEMYKGMRTSIVFVDKQYFDEQVEIYKQATVNTDISLILVDLENEVVLDEVAIPKKDGETLADIFKEPVTLSDEEDDRWPDDFTYDDDFEE